MNEKLQDVGYLDNDNTDGFGPENYVVYNGLSEEAALGEYSIQVRLASSFIDTTWTLTASINDDIVWVEEGDFAASTSSSRTTDDDLRRRRLTSSFTFDDDINISSEVFTVTLDSYTSGEC